MRPATKALLSVVLLLAGGSVALGQAGSTGGTLGKTGKSMSGEDGPAAPETRTKSPAKPVDKDGPDRASGIAGRWHWDADCGAGGHWQGEFNLADTARGHFNAASRQRRRTTSDLSPTAPSATAAFHSSVQIIWLPNIGRAASRVDG
jgi:hypothetical protein